MISLLDNSPNQPTKFRAKNWVEINDKSRRTYNADSQISFKTLMLRSILCDYGDAYILVKGPITVANTAAVQAANNAAADNADKKVIFKICASFTS